MAAAATRQGIGIEGRNPLQNRIIERTELKKSVISILKGGNYPYEMFGSIIQPPPFQFPEIDIPRVRNLGQVIQFFEQAFEWPQMTYVFYPYYWGRKKNWLTVSQLEDPDPIFAAFLKAGSARVIVPVRPGYETAMAHYMATGLTWNGGNAPQVDDPLYISIVQELKEQQDADLKGVPEGDPWEVRLPTTLVMLQEDSELPDFTP